MVEESFYRKMLFIKKEIEGENHPIGQIIDQFRKII